MNKQPIGMVLTLTLAVATSAAIADSPQGISKTKPESGRFVEVDGTYMVPYKATIPGTDIEYNMVPIPGGRFTMGSPSSEDGRSAQEGPQFEVAVEPFWMGKYEIRWEEYRAFMDLYAVFKEFESRKLRVVNDDNRVDAITAPTELYEPTFTFEFGEEPRQAAVTMTQYAAKQYTKWLSLTSGRQYRLPTEAEWEYACRAGTTTTWHFGDDPSKIGEYAWFKGNTNDEGQREIGLKKPNPWGLHDMHGNVAEWVMDELTEDGYKRFAGKSLAAKDAVIWPTRHYPRVVRGGSWEFDANGCRSASRLGSHIPDWKYQDPNLPLSPWWFTDDPARGVGFRLLRPLKPLDRDGIAKFWEIDHDDIQFDVDNRLQEGRGVRGLVDKDLPKAIEQLQSGK